MDIKYYKKVLTNIDLNDTEEYKKVRKMILLDFKHNIAQNLRIARELSKKTVKYSANAMGIKKTTLKRIESDYDRDEISLKDLLVALIIYDKKIDFYFNDWKENEKLLSVKNKHWRKQ